MEAPNLFVPWAQSNLGTLFCHTGDSAKIPSLVLAPELIFFRS